MRIKVFLSLALAAGFTGSVLGRPLPKPFIVRISEWYTTLNSTAGPINLGNCLIVLPDGGLHLELRRQEFFDGGAVLTTYESALDATEIGILRSILDDAGVSTLHPFAQPAVPMRFDHIEVFRAEIARAAKVQEVGYLTWQGEGPHNPEADKTAWKEASGALQPIVEWSHDVKATRIGGECTTRKRPVENSHFSHDGVMSVTEFSDAATRSRDTNQEKSGALVDDAQHKSI